MFDSKFQRRVSCDEVFKYAGISPFLKKFLALTKNEL